MGKLTKAQREFLAKCEGEGNIGRAVNTTVMALRHRGLIEKSPRAAPNGNWWTITPAGRATIAAGPPVDATAALAKGEG